MTPANRLLDLQMQEDSTRFGQRKGRLRWGHEQSQESQARAFICETFGEIEFFGAPPAERLERLGDRSFELVRLGAVEAQLRAMAAVFYGGVHWAWGDTGLDQGTLASIKQMTEELFGSPVGIRWIQDPGESPYWIIVAQATTDADPNAIVELHSVWHKKLVSLAPHAIGNVSLNVSCE